MIIELKDLKIGNYVYWYRKNYNSYLIGMVVDLLPYDRWLKAKLIESDKKYYGDVLFFLKSESVFFDSLKELNKFRVFS